MKKLIILMSMMLTGILSASVFPSVQSIPIQSISSVLPIATYTYDALARRLEKSATNQDDTLFISHGQRVIEEYSSTLGSAYALARSYAHGTYIDDIVAKIEAVNTPTILYYHTDRQFNVRGLTDSTGNIKELYAYSVYGQQTIMGSGGVVRSNTTRYNNYGFTGRYLDEETGLWYFRARYFSDELGRFISRDPLGYVDGLLRISASPFFTFLDHNVIA